MKRSIARIRIIAIWGLAASCAGLGVLMINDRLPWTIPKMRTYGFGGYEGYVLGGRLFIEKSYSIDESDSAIRDFRIGGLRVKREVLTLLPDDLDPIRYIATITLQIPTWPLFLLLGLYPTYALVFARKRRRDYRRRRGLCVKCGYDLTGNTTGTCPECGTPTCEKP